ncbi:MAG TPA: HEAT repeat domain-containing protein [Kofleriaceae bacterium]
MAAVVGGVGSPILHGQDVMRAVLKATRDPALLARAAMAINQRAGQVLDVASDDYQRKRGVTAPTLSASALDFWVMAGSPSRSLYHAHLDLAALSLDLQSPVVPDAEQLADAVSLLIVATAGNTQTYDSALDLAIKHCGDAAVRKVLFDALAHGKQDEFRARVATALKACGAAAVEPLIATLEKDPSANVKGTAAGVLDDLGDARAKPALEKAANSSDATVSYMANDALKKFK